MSDNINKYTPLKLLHCLHNILNLWVHSNWWADLSDIFSREQFFVGYIDVKHKCYVLLRMEQAQGETIVKEIQLPNQSLQRFDSNNRGKMQYQTELKPLMLRSFFYFWLSGYNNEPEIFTPKMFIWTDLVHSMDVLLIYFIFYMWKFNFLYPLSREFYVTAIQTR